MIVCLVSFNELNLLYELILYSNYIGLEYNINSYNKFNSLNDSRHTIILSYQFTFTHRFNTTFVI